MDTVDRYEGSLLGLACGDAVGTTVEFQPRGTFAPVTSMLGGGPFGLAAGQWTDDTSMALCLTQSLIECGGFDPGDQMRRYVDWWHAGYLSCTGDCFDIGGTVAAALRRFERTGDPFAGSTDPCTAGNGSLMRLAPVVLYYHPSLDDVLRFSADSSRTTHAAPEAVECCQVLGVAISRALAGADKAHILALGDLPLHEPKVIAIAQGDYIGKSIEDIRGTGYCVASLEAALWCFERTDSFEAAVLEAVNLGDDADTTGAIVGQLAGAYYGAGAIPEDWLMKLHMREEIAAVARMLAAVSDAGDRGGWGAARMKPASPGDWKALPMPARSATITLDRRFTPAELDLIRTGVVPEEMEDKWFVYWRDDQLHFHRSWTGFCVYVVDFDTDEGRMVRALVNRDPDQYSQTDDQLDAELIAYLIDVLLLGRAAPFPSNEPDAGKSALAAWAEVGQAMLGDRPGQG
jgi:ADP-ribosyl-[dinitrogen reductase] hydrolase